MELNWSRLRKGLIKAVVAQVILEIVLTYREARSA